MEIPYGESHMIGARTAQAVAGLFASVGTSGYGAALDRLTRIGADFDMSCIFGFSAARPPVVIHDGYSETVDRRALRSYLRGAYQLDPFYAACIAQPLRPGLWRMRDLAPDAYYDAGFSGSHEVHPCISDQAGTLVEEIGYVLPLPDGFAATYSLMRNRGGALFDQPEIDRLHGLIPIVAASLRLHWTMLGSDSRPVTSPDPDEVFRTAFASLTLAQHAVTKLILRGHSNISIAGNLDITEGTVKQHRYNIYRRLGISSQSELFQRFIDHLGGQ